MPIPNRKFTLGAAERLKSRKVIERVFREGKNFALFPFKVHYLFAPFGQAQADVSAPPHRTAQPHSRTALHPLQAGFAAGSRHFKKAVDRNRIKRLTREAYRVNKQELEELLRSKGWSLAVFFVYTGKDLPDHSLVSGKIGVILQKLIKEARS